MSSNFLWSIVEAPPRGMTREEIIKAVEDVVTQAQDHEIEAICAEQDLEESSEHTDRELVMRMAKYAITIITTPRNTELGKFPTHNQWGDEITMWVSGGMSWGDEPNETCGAMWRLQTVFDYAGNPWERVRPSDEKIAEVRAKLEEWTAK